MKKLLILLIITLAPLFSFAGEGMWLPLFLKQLNEAEMKGMGMKISAEDIYSVNKGSLKDAIVQFGGGCTGVIVSGQGLLLTNHHCGYGQIQSHSTLEHNYLQDGFWSKNRESELPNPGLTATFIVRIEDVTENVLTGITDDIPAKERQSIIDRNINELRKTTPRESYQDALVRSFFEGNQYFMFITETYRDVRLVGAPPSSIGKFGADTDNWVWPRHTGDFSIFRIYADKNNRPADYSEDNIPYQPRHFLPVSMDGISEGDFTLVFGFPGRTNEYLPAAAIELQVDVLNPIRIGIRDRSLEIMDNAMRADPQVRIQYASKQARLANSWKKWKGESLGIDVTGGIDKKRQMESEFLRRVQTNPQWNTQYGNLLQQFEQLYREQEPYAKTMEYVSEIVGRNVELFQLVNNLHQYVTLYENNGLQAFENRKARLVQYLEAFHKDYRPGIDRDILSALMAVYFSKVNPDHISGYTAEQWTNAGKDPSQLAKMVFSKSQLLDPDLIRQLNDQPEKALASIRSDFAYQLVRNMLETNNEKVVPAYNRLQEEISGLQRTYMKALMEVFPEKRFYPDANSTLRVTYGNVAGYQPRDAVYFQPVTYLSGVIEKYVPGDYEFDLPPKLIDLYEKKDFGPYAENGRMPVGFIGTNHTTGGNSGSPAIDAYGNLIGLNFDRVWEGTMSDFYYDPTICRNIMVDIRYILFIVDKLGGAKHLVEEMKLVHPKGKK